MFVQNYLLLNINQHNISWSTLLNWFAKTYVICTMHYLNYKSMIPGSKIHFRCSYTNLNFRGNSSWGEFGGKGDVGLWPLFVIFSGSLYSEQLTFIEAVLQPCNVFKRPISTRICENKLNRPIYCKQKSILKQTNLQTEIH